MRAHIETRDCGCRIKHERVYVCERHAQLPEKLRDRISEMGSEVMAKEIDAARTLEKRRCAQAVKAWLAPDARALLRVDELAEDMLKKILHEIEEGS